MSLIRLRPRADTLYISQGRTVFAAGLDGFIQRGSSHGLFVHETRVLDEYRYSIDGMPPIGVVASNVAQHSWLGYYILLPPGIDAGEADQGSGQVSAASQQALELRLSRYVGEGCHEDVDLTNFSQTATSFTLTLHANGDFADQIEVISGKREQHGHLDRTWRPAPGGVELVLDYHAEHAYDIQGERGIARLHRGVAVRISRSDTVPRAVEDGIAFDITLGARGSWHACVDIVPTIEGEALPPRYACRSFRPRNVEYDRRRAVYLAEAARFSTPENGTVAPAVVGTLERAKDDLASLRLYDCDNGEREWTMSAGLPIYVALFGRDMLTAAWQSALAGTGPMRGTLAQLARWQGATVSDWRDEQPGRMLHEAHTGPLEVLNFNPRARYYGSVTTSAFYPVVVSELWHWTGDKDLVRPCAKTALETLRWLDCDADLNGDGFYDYRTRSRQGVKNQAWKDSSDAIVREDGSQVEPPIATCEEQAFVYAGKFFLAEVLWWLGDRDESRRLRREAAELKARFNDVFWMDDLGYFAMALGPDRQPIRSVASNPGHCLAAGIVDTDRAQQTADRLLASDLFSGWGIRTLSTRHPAYNPYSYHRGSVWPVEQGSFALGFMRYGLWDHLWRLARAQFDAAALFDHLRLPEVFGGHPRDEDHPFPALYPQANSPQAWSASAVFCLVQAMLGLYPYAPLNALIVDPHLPDWLPSLRITGLRVGDARVTLQFDRVGERTDYRVVDQEGPLHVMRQPSPWSLTAGIGERLRDALESILPGR